MKRKQIAIRRIGNSQGIVIPKPLLGKIGLEGHAEMTIERDALVLRRPAKAARAGWAAAAQKIAEFKDDELVPTVDETKPWGSVTSCLARVKTYLKAFHIR
jgi:antitoxin MazE